MFPKVTGRISIQKLLPAPIQNDSQFQPDPQLLQGRCDKISRSFPTTSELVNLAATLAHGRQINPHLAEQLAKEVFELWKGCSEQRQKNIEQQARREIAFEIALMEGPVLQLPFKFPISFDEFLRLTVGGKSKATRLKTYRDYAKQMIYLGHVKALVNPSNPAKKVSEDEAKKRALPALIDEVECWIQRAKQEIFKNREQYELAAGAFLNWLQQQPTERAKKAATRRWSQDRRHKATVKKLKAAPLT